MKFLPRFPLFTAICIAVTVASVALPLPNGGAILGLPSPCPFFHITGLPCPGCGLTRSFVCCGHGRILEAFTWHPLGPVLFAVMLGWIFSSFTNLRWQPRKPDLWWAGALLTFGFFWVLRLSGVFPMPASPKVTHIHWQALI